jgi:hypothetical protein
MTLRNPPLWLQGGSHTAENDRLGTQLITGISGVADAVAALPQTAGTTCTGDFAVTATGSGLGVSIAAGGAFVLGTSTSTQGMYTVYNDGAVTLTLGTAPASNTRIDLIVLRINDAAYAGSTNSVTLEVVAGTAAGSPVAPTVPVSSIALCQILVGTNATTLSNSVITDRRSRAGHSSFFMQSALASNDAATIQAITSQTGNLLAIRNASGTLVNGFDSGGNLIAGAGGGYSDIFMLMGA